MIPSRRNKANATTPVSVFPTRGQVLMLYSILFVYLLAVCLNFFLTPHLLGGNNKPLSPGDTPFGLSQASLNLESAYPDTMPCHGSESQEGQSTDCCESHEMGLGDSNCCPQGQCTVVSSCSSLLQYLTKLNAVYPLGELEVNQSPSLGFSTLIDAGSPGYHSPLLRPPIAS